MRVEGPRRIRLEPGPPVWWGLKAQSVWRRPRDKRARLSRLGTVLTPPRVVVNEVTAQRRPYATSHPPRRQVGVDARGRARDRPPAAEHRVDDQLPRLHAAPEHRCRRARLASGEGPKVVSERAVGTLGPHAVSEAPPSVERPPELHEHRGHAPKQHWERNATLPPKPTPRR